MNAMDVFRSDFPEEYLKILAAGLRDCYRNANRLIQETYVTLEVRQNTYPWLRRGLIEDMMMSTAAQFGESISAAQVDSGHFWWHSELRAGRIVLTQCASSGEDAPVRQAQYKNELAKKTQRLLFPEVNDPPNQGIIYATLLHNKAAGSDQHVGYAQIRFPKPGLTSFYEGGVDLLVQFPDVFEQFELKEEVIEDSAIPKRIQRREASGA